VQLGIGQLIGAVGTVLFLGTAAFWAVASFANSGLRADVSAIRSTLATLQGSDKDNAVNIKQTEVDSTKQIGALNVTLATFNAKMDSFGMKVDGVTKSIDQLSGQMDMMQKRIAEPQEVTFNPEAVVQALKKAGVPERNIVIVPSGGISKRPD
jgi:hypothetical protein